MSEETYYLDTSAMVKRYVVEPGSEVVDEVFKNAYRGLATLSFSYWNIAEAAVVFDKYSKILGLNAKELMKNMLREIKTLNRLQKLKVIGITPTLIRNSIQLVFKHHIYVADALQIVSAKTVESNKFLTGDKKLAKIAEQEGLQSIYIGK
ncbi:type II toxin-antitoxin system VapC family toxin [Ignisphaera sp. 4213-co]|uniref:Type II toxin-antitoxin system VapC family toxin n=1 Tax=Ignisphaera cupida TaxID=3050454 RepID=A0ABD4Z6F3_9CREN|nr:type II toxin-antitoxin system VapC family toxin [Ignisphaera sp. 4213-co]MDK6028912.1 type II toxin-antitoxin system VapC family toxin [Ignisphaera sp. 4213-co]